MGSSSGLIAVVVSMILLVPAANSAAQEFDALIGTWVLNVSKSQWGTATPPKSQIRTFDYTHDGLIICTWRNVNAKGQPSFVHWFTKLDGEHRPEYSRGRARDSFSSISVKRTGPDTFEIEGKRLKDNWVTFTGTATISKDGKTLTWRVADRRDNNDTVRIYEKEEAPAR